MLPLQAGWLQFTAVIIKFLLLINPAGVPTATV